MKNKWIIFLILLAIIICVILYFVLSNNNIAESNNYSASKTALDSNSSNNNNNSNNYDNAINDNQNHEENTNKNDIINDSDNNETAQNPTNAELIEEEIASFTTKIYTKDSARQNNIQITSSTLNDIVVKNDTVFSFCNTVGPSTSAKGYQEADIFDKNGNKKKGLGGGNCQISTTLYNAVLSIPDLVVIERHQHSNKVPYIQNGKDAAVAYGSCDFKFKNQTGNDVKIKIQTDNSNVTAKIIKLTTAKK